MDDLLPRQSSKHAFMFASWDRHALAGPNTGPFLYGLCRVLQNERMPVDVLTLNGSYCDSSGGPELSSDESLMSAVCHSCREAVA